MADAPESVAIGLKSYAELTATMPTTVELLPFVAPCSMFEIYRVITNGTLPPFLYVDEISPAARVYPVEMAVTETNMQPLCNGVTSNNLVPKVTIDGYESLDYVVQPVVVDGYDSILYSTTLDTLLLSNPVDWTLNAGLSSATKNGAEVTLNLSTITTTYSGTLADILIAHISQEGRPSGAPIAIYAADNPNLPPLSLLIINNYGEVRYSGPTTPMGGGMFKVEFFMVKYNLTS
jgi:hypothetical protein